MPDGAVDALLPRVGDLLLGRYRIEQIVGRGAAGVVFAARHEMLGQNVAVKVLQPTPNDEEARGRILSEARASIRIKSEHVAQVTAVGTLESGLPFVVTQLAPGQNLRELLDANGPMPVARVVDLAMQALEGLSAAHGLGIVHGDLKLSNLFVASDTLKILDFGLSSLAEAAPHVSPEQVERKPDLDARVDIWALGMILYELLTGVTPFTAESASDVFVAILDRRPDLPAGLDQVIFKCLQRDRDARYSNVTELARALAPFGTEAAQAEIARIEANLAVEPAPDTRRGGFRAAGRGGTLIMRAPIAPPSSDAGPVSATLPAMAAPVAAATPTPPPPTGGPPSGPPPVVPPHLIVPAAPRGAPPPSAPRAWSAPRARPQPNVALIGGLAALAFVVCVVLYFVVRAVLVPRDSAKGDAAAPSATAANEAAAPEPTSADTAVPPATGVASDDTPPPPVPTPSASASATASAAPTASALSTSDLPPRVLPSGTANPSILDKRR
jgi:serine/threonine-protein kinase